LRLYSLSASPLGYEVRAVPAADWTENTLTHMTAPAPGHVLDTAGRTDAAVWSEADLTRLITGPAFLDLALLSLTDGTTSYASREMVIDGLAAAPQLVLEIANQPSPPPTNGVVIAAVGDIAGCNATGDEATAALLDEIPGLILGLGDTVYEVGSTEEFANCFHPAWGRHTPRIRPAIGNHEYLTPNAAPYFAYFGAAAGDPTQGYYSYTVGDWQIIALNSNCSKVGGCHLTSPQYRWLQQELTTSTARCTLAYFHHPLRSSGKYQMQIQVRHLVRLLYTHNADLTLAGHAHNYERFAPQDADGNFDPARGIVEFVVGSGGKNHQPVDVNVLPNSKVRNGDTFGVLQLTLYPDRYQWQFVPIAGGTFTDSGWASCH
jgi:acid phosphatase type 7